MIDLTPLDVRNKRGDFKKGMRGYDPQEVDVFLELVAERLEALVRENIQLRDRTQALQEQVDAQSGREQAVQDALVTAQELRKDIREQSQREADHVMREAESEARRMIAEADAEVRSRLRGVERQVDHLRDTLQELERRRSRFLQDFRSLLQRELDVVEVEQGRTPLEERTIDLDLGSRSSFSAGSGPDAGAKPAAASTASDAPETVDASAEDDADAPSSDSAVEDEPEEPKASLDDDVGELARRDAEERARASGTLDVSDLQPNPDAPTAKAPPPSIGDQPSSLELELMAGAEGAGSDGSREGSTESVFPDVPDLETVLAEAGIDEVRPAQGEEISPPPPERRRPEDSLVLFDKDEEGKKKKKR